MSGLRICILAPVNTYAYNQQLLDAVRPVIPTDVQVEVRNIRQGNPCIENRLNLTENALAVVRMAHALEQEGFQGIWLSDFDMCGVEAAREVIDIPIVGGFPTSAFSALNLSQRFSIITIMQSTLAMQRGHVATYGLSESFASIRSIDCPVEQLSNLDVVVAKTFEVALQAAGLYGLRRCSRARRRIARRIIGLLRAGARSQPVWIQFPGLAGTDALAPQPTLLQQGSATCRLA